MLEINLKDLNTFDKGEWLLFASKELEPIKFEENCAALFSYTKNTYLCLKKMEVVEDLLATNSVFIFIDKNKQLRLIGHCSGASAICGFRGLTDGAEQNIDSKYYDVAHEFLDKNQHLYKSENWKRQIEWIESLRRNKALFSEKRYNEISPQELIDDLSYNGHNVLYEGRNDLEQVKQIYYPVAKRELLSEPMLKPMLAKYLGCKTSELQLGKYNGNGKGVRFVVGDLISNYISKDSPLEKVYGQINVHNYKGEFNILNTDCTDNFSVTFDKSVELDGYYKNLNLHSFILN